MIRFLGIGAQKAGTSWVWSKLQGHPEVWMPPVKEVHFFDRDEKYESPNYLTKQNFLKRVTDKKWLRVARHLLKRDENTPEKRISWKWKLTYLLGAYDEAWYDSLFHSHQSYCCGEFSPGYALLDDADVARIKIRYPKLKIIYMLRNPVERDWSAFRYNVKIGKISGVDLQEVSLQAFLEKGNQKAYVLKSAYRETIERWRRALGKDCVFIGFYDEIESSPQRLLNSITSFLGIAEFPELNNLNQKINSSKSVVMPEEIRAFLGDRYRQEIAWLAKEFGRPAEGWSNSE